MALTGKIIPASGTEAPDQQESFSVNFTNGTLAQLREIHSFLKREGVIAGEDLTDVIKVGISILVGAKENKDKDTESK